MARERDQINFRAWDEYHGKMRTCEEFPLYYEVDNGFHSGLFADNGDWYALLLMQSTGLRDSSGREIYEDDIVSLPGNPTPQVVAWNTNDAAWRFRCAKGDMGMSGIASIGEVIGNIHANPELLTE